MRVMDFANSASVRNFVRGPCQQDWPVRSGGTADFSHPTFRFKFHGLDRCVYIVLRIVMVLRSSYDLATCEFREHYLLTVHSATNSRLNATMVREVGTLSLKTSNC